MPWMCCIKCYFISIDVTFRRNSEHTQQLWKCIQDTVYCTRYDIMNESNLGIYSIQNMPVLIDLYLSFCSYNIPQLFSSCSLTDYERFLNSRNPECLLNKPQAKDVLQPAVCGNGFQETGELCDCGPVNVNQNLLMI